MGGFQQDKAVEMYAIPENDEAVAAIALGYLGDPAQLSERRQKQETTPRKRRPLTEFVFGDEWGEVSEWVK